jgi:predicted RNA-binding protein with RPS1 domain
MILKLKADEFLQSIVAMRDNAVREAIQQAIQKNHEPYRVQMVAKRDKELADKEQTFNALIAQLTKEHEAEKATCKAGYEKAIQSHRDEVARTAEANAKGEYDKFILGVSAVADEIKEN